MKHVSEPNLGAKSRGLRALLGVVAAATLEAARQNLAGSPVHDPSFDPVELVRHEIELTRALEVEHERADRIRGEIDALRDSDVQVP